MVGAEFMSRITFAVVTLLALAATAPASAQSSDVETLTEKEVPSTVTSRMRCRAPSGPMSRRSFAGGFVFTQSCTDGGEAMVRVVYATARDGTGARILQFLRPEGRRMSALATVEFKPAENEVSGTTRKLTRRICRAEGRWRMEGKQPSPGLVFWRQNAACDGDSGWQTTVGRRK
jgi:hypothetical protein